MTCKSSNQYFMQDIKVEGHLPDDQIVIYDELNVSILVPNSNFKIFILNDRINQLHH